jgi:hypothetical protein
MMGRRTTPCGPRKNRWVASLCLGTACAPTASQVADKSRVEEYCLANFLASRPKAGYSPARLWVSKALAAFGAFKADAALL